MPVSGDVATRPLADATMGSLARVLVRIFFRSLEVSGADEVPAGGPLIEVANHQNGLVDGLVLIAASRRYPRFLAKSTLWRIVPLRPFLALAGAVPVYRGTDAPAGADTGQRAAGNRAALSRAAEVVGAGGAVGVFPEGVSHDLASLQELRSGAARLALDAAEGNADVSIVPAGMFYDDKSRFRSRVLVCFGPPRRVAKLLPSYHQDPRATVRRLTAEIAGDLRAVGPDFESVAVAARCERLAALATTGMADRERLARRLAATRAEPAGAARWADLDGRLDAFTAGLERLGLDDDQLVAAGRGEARTRRLTGPLAAVVTLPVAGAGAALHAGPYLLMRAAGRIPRNQGMRSTVKLLGSFWLYAVEYVAVGVVVGRRRGPLAGAAAAGAAPLSGWLALRTLEETQALGGLRQAGAVLRRRRHAAAALLTQRDILVREVRAQAQLDEPTPIRSRP